MIHTVQRMLKQIRWETAHDESEFSGSADVEMMYLNDAQDMIFDKVADYRPEMLSSNFTIELDGSLQYYLPDYIPFDFEQILMVEDYTNSDSPSSTGAISWQERMNYIEGLVETSKIPFSVRGKYLELPNKTNSATIRVWYVRRPTGLFYGTVAAGSSTTVTFPATPTAGEVIQEDDYYNGMSVYVGGQTREITDYVGSTRVATVDSAWSTTPTTSDTVELISPLPSRLHKLIVHTAVRMIKVGLDEDDTLIARFVNESVNDIIQRLREPHKQGAVRVRKISRFE